MTQAQRGPQVRMACVLLTLLLLLPTLTAALTLPSFAAAALPAVRVENKTVHRGQTFTLQVYLDENPGLVAMILELSYDKTAMSLVGVERGDALASHTFTTTNTDTALGFLVDPFRLLWDGTTQDTSTGCLLTLTFESRLTAPIGDYPVSLTYDAENTNSAYGTPIAVEIDNGTVTLQAGEFTVVYRNYDGTELQRSDYNDGDAPAYTGATPTRPTDAMYSYVFSHWSGAVSGMEKEIWYVAQYDRTPEEYQVTYYVDGEFFAGRLCGFGEYVDLSLAPSKQNHTFSGWYTDEAMTERVTAKKMPAEDLILYGTMRFNVRQTNIPQITLSVDRIENGVAYVAIDVTRNTGIAGLVLTLDYDREAFTLLGVTRGEALADLQFAHTNTSGGWDADPFRLYWEGATNNTEEGRIATLQLVLNESAPAALYGVTVTYDERTDATFFTEEGELWYTRLEILGTKIPIGLRYHWYEELPNGIGIDVTVEEGQSPATVLRIRRVTELVGVSGQTVTAAAGEGMEIKDVYTIELVLDGVVIEPKGRIAVKIQLTDAQANCERLMLFHLAEDGSLTAHPSRVEDAWLTFETEHLSEWAIVGEVTAADGGNGGGTWLLFVAPMLLAIVTMALVLILIARAKKHKTVFEEPKND